MNAMIMPDYLSKEEVRDLPDTEKLNYIIQKLESIDPIVAAYDGVLFGKKVIMGISGVIIFLASVGGAVLWLIDFIRHYKT